MLQGVVDLLFASMELMISSNIPFSESLMTCIKVVVLKRLQDKLTLIDVPSPSPFDLKSKVEIKICIDFVKGLLNNPEMVYRVYIENDFTCVKRPIVTTLLNTCVRVLPR